MKPISITQVYNDVSIRQQETDQEMRYPNVT